MSGLEVLPGPDETGTSSSSSGTGTPDGSSSSSGKPGACQHAKEPAKPAPAAGGSDTTLTFAMFQMVPRNTGTPFGLDLDGLCTCFTEVGKTTPDPGACKRSTPACDNPLETGLDNAGSAVFKDIDSAAVNPIQYENERVAGGNSGLLLRIEGYNGLDDDDAISVRLIRSAGVAPARASETVKQEWPDSDESFVASEAYVAQRVVVARFPEVLVPFLAATPSPARMKGAVLVGELKEKTAIPELLLAGRTNTSDMVNGVGQLEVTIPGLGPVRLCQALNDSSTARYFSDFATLACKSSDMPSDPASDRDLEVPCDAMSFGLRLLMVPANLGAKKALPSIDDGCGGVDGYPVVCTTP